MLNFLGNIASKFYSGRTQKVLLILSACFIFFFLFVLNRLFPLYIDDWIYSFVYGELPLRRVASFSDIIVGQYNHYFLWGGRSLVHVLAQLLLMLPPVVQDFLNTSVFLLFVFVIYKIANYKNNINSFAFIISALLLWFYTPVFTHNILWITGSANYLWSCSLMLLFIYPYFLTYRRGVNKGNDNVLRITGFFFLGIFAGWMNENMGAALIFMIIVFCISFRRLNIFPRWATSGLIGLCIGFTIMVMAPGNYLRMEALNEVQDSFFNVLLTRIQGFPLVYHHCMYQLLILYVVLLFVAVRQCRKDRLDKKIVKTSLLFVITAHVALFALVGTPVFPLRALFGVVAFMIVGIVILYANIQLLSKQIRILNILAVLLLCIAFMYNYYRIYPSIYLISKTFENRAKFIEQQKKEGITDIVFNDKIGVHYKFEFQDLSEDVNNLLNQHYASFYGVQTVKVVSTTKEEN